MVYKILAKMRNFLLICAIALALFANSFLLLFASAPPDSFPERAETRDGQQVGGYFSFFDSITTIFEMMLGSFRATVFVGASNYTIGILFFVVFMVVVAVVLLNLLIAVVSDHYEDVLLKSKAEFLKERAQMLLQAMNAMSTAEYTRCAQLMTWVYVAVPRDGDRELKVMDDASTRHRAVTNALQRVQNHVEESVTQEIDKNTRGLQTSYRAEMEILHNKVDNLEKRLQLQADTLERRLHMQVGALEHNVNQQVGRILQLLEEQHAKRE